MRYKFSLLIVFLTTQYTLQYGQNYISIQSGINFYDFRTPESIHEKTKYNTKPTFSISAQYFKMFEKSAPLFGIAYKKLDYHKTYSSNGLSPSWYYEELYATINLIELNASQRILLKENNPFFFRVGLQYSLSIDSKEKGKIITSNLEQEPDTNLYHYVTTEKIIDRKSDYKSDYGILLGIGIDIPIKNRIGVNVSVDTKPMFGQNGLVVINIRSGLVWLLEKKNQFSE